MRKLTYGLSTVLLIVTTFFAQAQKKSIKFGDVTTSDLAPQIYSIDSNANAVILSDVGSSKYEGNNSSGFNIVFKRHTRIKILSRKGFDVATFEIPIYAANQLEEKIESLEAQTYNLESGKVEITKLDKASIFKDRINKNFTVRKFTMPNLKEGCIIEVKYTFVSPYERDLRGWEFQGQYPTLFSEYKATVPSIYTFVTINQGYQPYLTNKQEISKENYSILVPGNSASDRSEVYHFSCGVVTTTWAMQDVPALKMEKYTTSLSNHLSKVSFQLSKISYPDMPVKNVMTNWVEVSDQLMKDPDFGETLAKNNNWLDDDMKLIVAGAKNEVEKAKRIYAYVRDNFTCTSHSRKYLSNPLKKTFQSKSGSVADLNLLLTAMFIQQGFDAKPVLLSTRDHGKVFAEYPVMDQLNYVLSKLTIDDQTYLLDASYTKLGFGKLSTDCYNGYARVIDKMPTLISLEPDSLREQKATSIFIINDEKEGLSGTYNSTLGYDQSYDVREAFSKTSAQEYFKGLSKSYSFDVNVSNGTIDSLKNYEQPVAIKYDFKFKSEEDIIYLNPLFSEAVKENPFKAAERFYPVEMPYAINELYVLRMEVPKGYKVEELPKSSRVKFNEDEGMFEYLVNVDRDVIQLRSIVKFNKATFLPDDYQSLRDFYTYIVKKHSEQIVLKKIK